MDTDPVNEVKKDTQSVKVSLRNKNRPATADRLRRYLLFLIVFLPCLAILGMLFFSSINNQRVYEKQARALLKNTTSETTDHTKAFLTNVANHVSLTVNIYKQHETISTGTRLQENYFISHLEVNPSITGLYTANLEGDFFHVSRTMDADKGKYNVQSMDWEQDGFTAITWWRNMGSQQLSKIPLETDGFDPRTRPWFNAALENKRLIWTEPYIFFTRQKLGITAAKPVISDSNEITGIIGVDVELTELVEFLSKLEISRYGSSFIASKQGVLIAAASMLNDKRAGDLHEAPTPLEIESSTNVLTKEAFNAVFSLDKDSFEIDNERYLVESMPLADTGNGDWRIVAFANENEFLSEIRNSEKDKYSIAGLITLLSMLLGWFLAKTTWKPIADMEQKANYDQLTQLYNRNYLEDHADDIVNKAISNNQPLSVAILDIDLFKPINDTYGHDVGDIVLQIFAIRLLNQRRPLDTVIRYGGEEFIVIMPNTTPELAASVIDNARLAMSSRLYEINDYILKVTFSAGIAELDEENNTFKDIMKAADMALYRSKHLGRDQVNIAHKEDIQAIINHA